MQSEQGGRLSDPHVVEHTPFAVAVHENDWITLADGCRLAVRRWMPVVASGERVPAILEFLPYRKRDGTSTRDALTHPFFAGHGYACLRVDMRGSGDSDGLLDDEYSPQELADAVEVIEWIAAQPWSNGKVGMMGISWGGFNGLQVASMAPEALKAVVTLCSTDDRYADDIHYKGGALLGENQGWGATMLAYQSRPPDPLLRPDDWREVWLRRLQQMPFLFRDWLAHPRRDAYWRHGSVCEDFARVRAAVLAVGGWGDAYSNAVPRLLNGLAPGARAIIGPWIHKYPHFAVPQPAIDFLGEALRWWDRHLHGSGGDGDEAVMRCYLMDAVRPAAWYEQRSGQWLALDGWPDSRTRYRRFGLARSRLRCTSQGDDGGAESTDEGDSGAVVELSSPATTGAAGGEFCAIWLGPDMPVDQRLDDGGSALFDSAPLAADLAIVGAPALDLSFSVDRPVAQVAVRLCDVWPDGASTRITYAVLNLNHCHSHAVPEALVPGRQYHTRVALDDVAYRVPAGHRLRVAVSTAYWPLIWPAPEPVRLRIALDASRLEIPWLDPVEVPEAAFGAPRSARPQRETVLREAEHRRELATDLACGTQVLRIYDDHGRRCIDAIGLETDTVARETFTIDPDDPASARASTHWTEGLARGNWSVRTETYTEQWTDGEHFFVSARLEAWEYGADGNETLVFERDWQDRLPRELL